MADDERQKLEKRLGTVLKGKWKLEKLLGFGGMAAVYQARHQIGTEVAVKLVHPEVARSKELRMRFEQEARVMARLKHPGAVEVRDVDHTAEGLPFLVMELLNGEPLSDRMRRLDTVPVDDVLRFMDELLDVLSAAHKQGIIHRDIKLDNLFITDAGSVKVLDFGIARVRDAIALTMVGARLGTLPYMPPEQVTGKAVDGRADIFAVGAVMFRLIGKRRIHEAKTEQELLVKMTSEPAPPLAAVAPSAPTGLCLIVDRALAFDRNRRYPDAATMQADVQALRKGQEPPYATQRLASDGPPNPLSDASPHSAAPKTMATAVASPLAKQADPLSETGLAPAGAVPADRLSDTGLAPAGGVPPDRLSDTKLAPPSPAAKHASHPHAKLESTQVASAGAAPAPRLPAVAVAVETVEADLPPGSTTAAATPFEAHVASVRQLAAKTAVLASSEAQIAKHTMVSSGPVAPASQASPPQVAVMEAAPGSMAAPTPAPMEQPPLSGNVAMATSQPSMSDPLNQTLGSAGVSPLAGPASAAAPVEVQPKQDDTRMPAAVWLSLAGAVLLLVVIGAFIAWPSATDETVGASVDGAEQASEETASEGDGERAAAEEAAAHEAAVDETAAARGSGSAQDTAASPGNEVAASREAAGEPLARETNTAPPRPPAAAPSPKPAPSPAPVSNDEKAKERERKEEEKRRKQAEKEAKKRGGRGRGH